MASLFPNVTVSVALKHIEDILAKANIDPSIMKEFINLLKICRFPNARGKVYKLLDGFL